MRLFLDSSDIHQWSDAARANLLYGVTTNPLIFKREGLQYSIQNITRLIDTARDLNLRELQIQVTEVSDPEAAIRAFMPLYERWPQGIVAKVPFCPTTAMVLERLPLEVPVTMTTGYAATQAILATQRGARYIAPYYGRLQEAGEDADQIVDDMLAICTGTQTRVLVASLRNNDQLISLCRRGHDTFTISPSLMHSMLTNRLSEQATIAFEDALQNNR